MFSFLNKSFYLKDLLVGFTDIHNHLLPGIDDGAKLVEDSIELIRRLKNLGIEDFINTPHTMNSYYPNTPETIRKASSLLRDHLDSAHLDTILIRASSEYMMDSHFENILEANEILPLKSNYVLVEMSYLQPPINLEEIIYKVGVAGYTPVLAHPERYAFFHHKYDYYKTLKKYGCLFQLNMLSLSPQYGSGVMKTANQLLKDDMIDFLGSDIHHIRHVENIENLKLKKVQVEILKPIINKTTSIFKS